MRRKVEFKLKTASGPERGALRQRVNEILQQEFDMYAVDLQTACQGCSVDWDDLRTGPGASGLPA
ncbi:uncharacterized protein MYCGRDRAFT_103814 [Zymoseptoria tritici IPO323]|uniref:Uncharacterized protein n=1 Tax=Zymoseptoria tritici (strain CBS 115943 / IPO323) TaxID=336722 RepID=F9X6Z8_ZYMTI|nr:uncharacterized protein MYCGRDRAFT_103814 [Zymoseptoria tritici IPO323]EGP89319.1 hypothetical protein MYCGRDRAFT_103814 [Zymoseptoria tritici IPO323]